MIAWFTRNPVAANLLMLAILAWGLGTVWDKRIPIEFFPRAGLERIRVQVQYEGSSPEEVERGITERIEAAIFDLQGIDEMYSTSSENGAQIRVDVSRNHNERDLLAEIESRVGAINDLPSESERPVVRLDDKDDRVITVALMGELPESTLREMVIELRDELLRLDGISTTRLRGVRDPEITIEIDEVTLEEYGLSIDQVASTIRAASVDLSAGSLRTEAGNILLRTEGQAWNGAEFRAIPLIRSVAGTVITVGDVATVRDGFAEDNKMVFFDGKPAAMVSVERAEGQDMVEIAKSVKAFLTEYQQELPPGVTVDWWQDRTAGLTERMDLLLNSALWGAALVLILLALFLRLSVAFFVMMGIPLAMIGGLAMMPILGTTINIMSLFAFILVLGIVVDDAIVTGESVYSRLRHGGDRQQAAIEGTKAVAIPVTFGVLTTMVAFIPLAILPGWRGDIFKQLPLVIVPVLFFSLIESKLILPSHLAHLRVQGKPSKWNPIDLAQKFVAKGLRWFVRRVYLPLLGLCVRWRLVALVGFVLLFLMSVAVVQGRWLPWVFFQQSPSTTIEARVVMPPGTSEESTETTIRKVADYAEQIREEYHDPETGISLVEHVSWTIGEQRGDNNPNVGELAIDLISPDKYPPKWKEGDEHSVATLTQEWRELVGPLPEALEISFWSGWGGQRPAIDLDLRSGSREQLAEASERVEQFLRGFPALFDIRSGEDAGNVELVVQLTEEGRLLGVTEEAVARQLRSAIFGAEVQRFQRGQDQLRVRVRLPREQRESLATLDRMQIVLEDGQRVPLRTVARWHQGRTPPQIQRIDRQRRNSIYADADETSSDLEGIKQQLRGELPSMMVDLPTVDWEMRGDDKEQRQTFDALSKGLIAVLLLIYILLAVPLRSYIQPLIVMSVIPFSFAGAIYGHLFMDWWQGLRGDSQVVLSIMSVFGMLALVGVVVNDSLVMVDAINQSRKRGASLHLAIIRSGSNRFRPILLTTLTTFFGLAPLLLDESRTGQTLAPMAISLGFGIMFTTGVTLLFVPLVYLLIEDVRRATSWIYGKRAEVEPKSIGYGDALELGRESEGGL